MALPGFSIELPRGDVARKALINTSGVYLLKDVDGTGGVAGVSWAQSTKMTDDELDASARGMVGAMDAKSSVRISMPGPTREPVPALLIETDKAPMSVATVPCASRVLIVI